MEEAFNRGFSVGCKLFLVLYAEKKWVKVSFFVFNK